MKSKFTTYLLVILVVVLWGIIVKKIFFSTPKVPPVRHTEAKAESKASTTEVLRLDYRDPFRPKPPPQPTAGPRQSTGKNIARNKPAPKENINMKYIGWLQCGPMRNYVVEINGRQHTLSLNEEVDGIRLVRVFSDSLHFNKNGTIHTLVVK